MAIISVYSQNVSGDRHSEELTTLKEMERWTFYNRIRTIISALPENVDVICLNEIRYNDRVEFVKNELKKKGFIAESFYNNPNNMSFNNILAVRNSSKWSRVGGKSGEGWEHKWVANGSKPFMSSTEVQIEGDKHGRCAGMVYLQNKTNGAKVCVMVSHVVPVGDVKKKQQNALMSASSENLKSKMPTIITGDFNRFPEEVKQFQQQLEEYKLVDAVPTKMIIPGYGEIVKDEDIGTFTPWPIDGIYNEKIDKPMSVSRLDVQLFTKDTSLIKLKSSESRAVMFSDPNLDSPKENVNKIRHILDRRMATDHLALICLYDVLNSK